MDSVKILIVEDNAVVGLDLKQIITKLGHEVTDIVKDSDSALKSVKKCKPLIVIMDINLMDGKNGIETAIEIQKDKNIQIIFLTAFSDNETIHKAIKIDPIGYLVKPYKVQDLKSMIILAIYKSKNFILDTPRQEDCQNIGYGYCFDFNKLELYKKGNLIRLGKKETTLLIMLLKAKGEIVPFEELERSIWDNEYVSDSSIRTLLHRVRAKLNSRIIVTVQYSGCKINLPK